MRQFVRLGLEVTKNRVEIPNFQDAFRKYHVRLILSSHNLLTQLLFFATLGAGDLHQFYEFLNV